MRTGQKQKPLKMIPLGNPTAEDKKSTKSSKAVKVGLSSAKKQPANSSLSTFLKIICTTSEQLNHRIENKGNKINLKNQAQG